jgi:hypothetical protein
MHVIIPIVPRSSMIVLGDKIKKVSLKMAHPKRENLKI